MIAAQKAKEKALEDEKAKLLKEESLKEEERRVIIEEQRNRLVVIYLKILMGASVVCCPQIWL